MNCEGDGDINCNRYTWNSPERFGKGIRATGDQKKNRDNPDCGIVENDPNTEKSAGDLKSLAVPRTFVKVDRLTLV